MQQVKKKWIKGTVKWFDAPSGRGVVEGEDGGSYNVHYSAIVSKDDWKKLTENQRVRFKALDDVDYKMVEKVEEIVA